MTSFRIKELLGAGALALGLITGALAAEAPHPAAPPPSEPTAQPPQGAGSAPGAPAPGGVETEPLATPESQLLGLIDSAHGGFSRDLWSGSDRQLIPILLARLPAAQSSPAMTGLARRLLLSRTDAPKGAEAGTGLTAVRLDRALAIGLIGTIEPLAQQVQSELARPEILGPRVDALLYQGADKDACALTERARGRTGDPRWIKRIAYCDALSGKVAEAHMGVDVLPDSGDADPAFASLMSRLVDKARVSTVSPEAPSAVHFALLRQTGDTLADAALTRAPPIFLLAWANYAKAPILQRVAAGERATASGIMQASVLLDLYRAVSIKPARLAAPFGKKTVMTGPDGAAYAIQRLARAKDVGERAHLMAAALRSGRDRGVLPAVAAALRPDLAGVAVADSLLDVGFTLATGEAMASGGTSARRWLTLARAKGGASSEAAAALRSLLSARRVAADLDWTQADMLARIKGAAPANRPRALTEWSLLRPLGLGDSQTVLLTVLAGPLDATGAAPMPVVLDGLEAAARQGRVGEAALYCLTALGEAGPRGAHSVVLAAVVRALVQVGLEADARAIAGEALAWRMP
jgi:hypothetical protein